MTESSSPTPNRGGRCYFHHIPKTAGTTLRNHLIGQIGESRVAPMVRGMSFQEALREYAGYDAITGHIAAVPGDRLPSDRLCVTLLRDPVERVISEFYFSRVVHESGPRPQRAVSQTLDDWVRDRAQGDAEGLNAHVALLWPLGEDAQVLPASAAKLTAAKRALDRFDLVGLQHQMADSIGMLDFLMGWPVPDAIANDNAGPARPRSSDIPPRTLVRLRELLAPDIELFAYGSERFGRQRSSILVAGARLNAAGGAGADREAVWVDSPQSRTHHGTAGRPANPDNGRKGTGEIAISSVQVVGDISGPGTLQSGEWSTIAVTIDSTIVEDDLTVGLALRDHSGALVFGSNTRLLGYKLVIGPGQYLVSFRFPNDLGLGRYSVTATAHRGRSHLERCFHWWESACTFEIANSFSEYFEGRMRLRMAVYAQAQSPNAKLIIAEDDTVASPAMLTLARRNPALTDFRASLAGPTHIGEIQRGVDCLGTLRVTNSGSERWGAYGRQSVQVSYHWLGMDGSTLVFEGLRTALPHDVPPGQTVTLKCFLRAPDVEGEMQLLWTLVQEEVAWFDAQQPHASLLQRARILG